MTLTSYVDICRVQAHCGATQFSFHFMTYSLGCGASNDSSDIPGLKAQVYVVCNKSKLVGVLYEKEPRCPVAGSLGQITKSADL